MKLDRRGFLKRATVSLVAASVPRFSGAEAKGEEMIDIHQHVNYHARTNAEMIAHQRAMGMSKTVLLPSGSQLARPSTHLGSSNGLAARVFGPGAAQRVAAKYPGEFVWFANEVPDIAETKANLEYWLERGACGIGEQKFGVDCDGKAMRLVYDVAKAYEVPVLIHFQHEKYNFGFERFHKILEAYPTVNFFGHAQTWWGNIDAKHVQTDLYPKGPVTPGGITDRYLSDYPNMFGDLSAGSGLNAMRRDMEHAAGFFDRHQDKLCYASDCADTVGNGEKCSGAGMRDVIRELVTDPEARAKIFSGNAKRLIKGLA
ncbi:MAG: amidohydrolase [Verrucomicrobiae bacterium]|nr:amidohydrolase [Verrucomicrobiae bacterium]